MEKPLNMLCPWDLKKAANAPIEFNSSFQVAESFYNLFNDTDKGLLNLASIEAAVFL